MTTFTAIHSKNAPEVIGCYSQAVNIGNLVFLSGQIALDPVTQQLITDNIEAEIAQVFRNLQAVAEAAGASLAKIVKLTIYLKDLKHFSLINDAMKIFFTVPYPARAVVEVAGLPRGALVEIEGIIAP